MTRRMIVPLLFGLVGIAILLNLGAWQVRRLHWKEAVLAQIDARIGDAPVSLPAAPSEAEDKYRAVRLDGRFLPGEIHVLTSRSTTGPGFRVIAPFGTDDGRRVLVDRGFIPERLKDADRPLPDGPITGNLHWPDEVDEGYTPNPDLGRNIWFARETARMAAALDTEPVLVVLNRTPPGDASVQPWPVDASDVRNNHLNYAITWFLLALAWAGMTVYWLWRIRRQDQTTDQRT
jgi:surfeit locus 1 family protein